MTHVFQTTHEGVFPAFASLCMSQRYPFPIVPNVSHSSSEFFDGNSELRVIVAGFICLIFEVQQGN